MGHRACYILIKNNGKRSFHFSRYGSKFLETGILGGPKELADNILVADTISETEWLDLGGGQDGGLLLDYQQRVLIWYGEEKTKWNPVYRGVFLKVARQLWKGWDIRWAYNSELDILDYAGYPREPLISDHYNRVPPSLLDPQKDGVIEEWGSGVLSIIDASQQCRLIPLNQQVYTYLLSGPAFFARWEDVPQLENLVINTIPSPIFEEPEPNSLQNCAGGIHLNLSAQTLDYWEKSHYPGMKQLISPMWSGWQITMHYDEFEWQEKITKGALLFKIESKKEILGEFLPLRVWSEKTGELDDQEIEETIAKLATRPYGPALFIKIMAYLILAGILILFLWVLMG